MTAKEVREYRNVSKKLAEVEERSKLLEELKKHNICLADEEGFVQHENSKFRVLGNKKGVTQKKHDEFVKMSLKYKIRDNNLYGIKLRRRRTWLRVRIENTLGKKSSEVRTIFKEVEEYNKKHKKQLKDKKLRQ